MNIKKAICGLVVLVLILLALPGCGTGAGTAIELVPQGVNFIAQVQTAKLLNDKDLMDAFNQEQPGEDEEDSIKPDLEEFYEETGIDLESFSEIVIFGDAAEMQDSESGYMGFIARGKFDTEQFIENVESKILRKINSSVYNGFTLYTYGIVREPAIAFIDDSMLIFGSEQAVKDVLDIKAGDKEPLSGPLIDTYNRLGDAALKAVIDPASASKSDLEDVSDEIPVSMDMFNEVDLIGLTFDKDSENVVIKAEMHFLDDESLQDGEDAIRGIIALFKSFSKDEDFKEFLDKIEVNSADSWLTINLTTTIDEMKKASDTMGDQ